MDNVMGPGTRIGRWLLQSLLGQGGFGTTWKAIGEDGQIAALKILKVPAGDEMRALSRVCHPSVVGVLDGGGSPCSYVVMEYVEGRELRDWLQKGGGGPDALSRDAIYAIIANLCDALAALHHVGMPHSDVKPENLIVQPGNPPRVTLVDFGLAGTRTGGTMQYAAPERLSGRPSSAAADIYAAGLLFWEMLHGSLPWSDLDRYQALMRRMKESPVPEVEPEWVRDLLGSMVSRDPGQRPEARIVADNFAAHGVRLPQPDADLLRRRARTVHVSRSGVDDIVTRWFDEGGPMVLVGPDQCGRTHTLDRIVLELQARGALWVRLVPRTLPWGAIEQALADTRLIGPIVPLPAHADPHARATIAARCLRERVPDRLAVIVDDLEELDEGSREVLAILAESDHVAVAVAADVAPEWARIRLDLGPFERSGVRDLLAGILGAAGSPERFVDYASEVSGGVPGVAIACVLQAVREGVLVQRAQRWLLDEFGLEGMVFHGSTVLDPPSDPISRHLGALLAIHGLPILIADLMHLSGLEEGVFSHAMADLVAIELVKVEAGLARCMSHSASDRLADVPEASDIHRHLAHSLLVQPDVPMARLGWHIVGAEDQDLARQHGARCIVEAQKQDPANAARLADSLWSLARGDDFVLPRLQALMAAGRVEEARAFIDERLLGEPTEDEVVALRGALARIHLDYRGDVEETLREVARVREIRGQVPSSLRIIEATAWFNKGDWERAIDDAQVIAQTSLPTDPEEMEAWLAARRIWALALGRRGLLREGLQVLKDVPEVGPMGPARALIDAARGLLLWQLNQLSEAADCYARAVVDDSGLPVLQRVRLHNNLAVLRFMSWDRPGALESWEQGLLLCERIGAEVEKVRIQTNLCQGYREVGRWERARQAGEWAVEKARELGQPDLEAMALGNLGDLFLAQGHLDRADVAFHRASRLAAEHDLAGEQVELARRQAEVAVRREDPAALELTIKATELARDRGQRFEAAKAMGLVAICLSRLGRTSEVEAVIQKASEALMKDGAAAELADLRLCAAEAFMILGRFEGATTEVDRVLRYANQVGHVQLRMRAEELRGRITRPVAPARPRQREELILDLAVTIAGIRDLGTVLDRIAHAARDLLETDRAYVILLRDGQPEVVASCYVDGAASGPPSFGVVDRCLDQGREVLIENMVELREIRERASVAHMELRMAMAVPIRDGDEVVGVLYVDSKGATREDFREAAHLVRALAAYASIAVAADRRYEDVRTRQERNREMVHDVKNALAGIEGALNSVRMEGGISPAGEQAFSRTMLTMRHIENLISRMADRLPVQIRVLDLGELARQVCDMQDHFARGHGVGLEARLGGGLWIKGDSPDLLRAMNNLVSNAIKYSPPGTVVFVVAEASRTHVVFSVRDQGTGVPEDQRMEIFKPGVRLSTKVDGQGLGLSIVRQIVTQHRGLVEARNSAEGGAVFRVLLPRAPAPGEEGPTE